MSRQIDTVPDPLRSREEVARQIGCCTRTVVRAEKRGELKAVKLSSRMTQYRASNVEQWIREAANELGNYNADVPRA